MRIFTSLGIMILASISLTLQAQTGVISGKVFDETNGEPLMFCNVLVEGSSIGASTDLDGVYRLEGLKPGTYTLVATYISYADKKVTDVEVKANDVTVIDIPMGTSSQTLQEVIVTSQALRNTEGALMTLRRKAFSVQDGISSQEITRYGSSNAAESMKSVTGASVMGGKYVFLRGIGERYNSTTLNNQVLPSVDPYRNAAQLDMIPANLLDNVVASKTFTPDQPGNSTGGNLNITTKSFPEELTMSFSMSTSFNTISSFRDDFLTFDGGDYDWLGYDDGTRDLPALFEDREILQISKAKSAGMLERDLRDQRHLISRYNEAAHAVSSQMAADEGNSYVDHGASFAFGNQVPLFGRPLGIIFNVSYNKSYTHIEDGDLEFWELNTSEQFNNYYDLVEDRSTESPEIGGMVGLSYKLTENNKISFSGIYNHNTQKSANYVIGDYPGKISGQKLYESRYLSFIERDIRSYQLKGEHVFPKLNDVKIDWNAGIINSMQLEPDSRVFDNTITTREGVDGEGNPTIDTFYAISKSEFSLPFHFWRDLNDEQMNGSLDLTIPFLTGFGKSNKLKFGASYSHKDRTFDEFTLEYNNVNSSSTMNYMGNPDVFFSQENLGVVDSSGRRPDVALYLRNFEEASLKNSYTGSETISAVYGMTSFEIGDFKIIGGARVERTDIQVASLDSFFRKGNIEVTDILPSVNLIYSLTDDINLRAAYTQTLARPNMRELAPFSSFDRGTDIRVTGNPGLDRTNIENFDLRAEWYPKPGELLAVSGFYKRFENPIVRAFNPRVANNEIFIVNVDEAEVYGVEFEVRKSLDFIGGGFFEHTRVISNLSLIQSFVDIPGHPDSTDTEQWLIDQYNPDKGFTRPFQGQSPFIVNAALNYANPDIGLDALLAFNVFGRRLTLNNGGQSPDFYEEPIPQLDFSISKTIGDNIKLRFSARNILDADYEQTLSRGDDSRVVERRERGVTFGFGVTYSIN
ncbi:MAG: TonB-dependent receptor [Saprospiraceae bacterium]|nr:TonB-dependent receptor [Saprospiraceae bacterium]